MSAATVSRSEPPVPWWLILLEGISLIVIMGIQGIIMGGVSLYQAFKGAGWGAGILGALSIIFGIVLLLNPVLGAAALPWVLGILAIVGGIASVVMAFRVK